MNRAEFRLLAVEHLRFLKVDGRWEGEPMRVPAGTIIALLDALEKAEAALDISLGHRCEDCGKCQTSREALAAIRALDEVKP